MKQKLHIMLMLLLLMTAASLLAQGGIKQKKCPTCGKPYSACPYHFNHPTQTTEQTSKSSGKSNLSKKGKQSGKSSQPSGLTQAQKDRIIQQAIDDMVWVEGGTFMMGDTVVDPTVKDYSEPAHQVTLSSYYIGKYEVTQELWLAVMGSNPSYFKGDLKRPVENVSWDDCQVFIVKLNQLTGYQFRMLTEAEWEFAARGGKKSKGFWFAGCNYDDIDDFAWSRNNSRKTTQPVGKKLPNELGLYDMSGNVREWVYDWYADYTRNPQTNPQGPSAGSDKVTRGGCFYLRPEGGLVFDRGPWMSCPPSLIPHIDSYPHVGLRLALTADRAVQSEPQGPNALDVTFSCNVADADMYIDGTEYGHPSGTRTLKTGSHQVKLVAEGYEDYTTTIDVKSGNTSFSYKMTRKPYVPKIETFTVKGVSFDMVWVEGGTFTMGATDEQGSDAYNSKKPTYQVTLSNYYIGKYEVTQALWQAVMGKNPSEFKGDLNRPVETVSWNDCQKFISKLNKLTGRQFRLPTEAEWEYAARGGKWTRGYKYAGSNDLKSVAWCHDNLDHTTHPVGTLLPNELGIYNMSGNVEEWCQDWDGSYYSSVYQTNPTGPSSGSTRVVRGGSWLSDARDCRVLYRLSWGPSYTDYRLGLRLAL